MLIQYTKSLFGDNTLNWYADVFFGNRSSGGN